MNFKQLKDFDFKNIDIDRNQFERITVGGYYFYAPCPCFW